MHLDSKLGPISFTQVTCSFSLHSFIISSSNLLDPNKSTCLDSITFQLFFLTQTSRLAEFHNLVILSSWPKQVDLPRFNNFSSCLLDPNKSTCLDSKTCHLAFLTQTSRLAEFYQLVMLSSNLSFFVILSRQLGGTYKLPYKQVNLPSSWSFNNSPSCPKQVNLPRFNNSSSCLLVPIKSTFRFSATRQLVFLSQTSLLAELLQLVNLSSHPF